MLKARIAEWILSQVTSPERAASTVGDLLEAESTVRFWMSVMTTGCSLLWRDFASDWRRMTGLAIAGWIGTFVFPIAFAVVYGFAFGLILAIASAPGLIDLQHFAAPIWISKVFGVFVAVLVEFQIGRWLARRSVGRELVPCTALLALDTAVWTVVWVVGSEPFGVGNAVYLLPTLSLFAGAVQVRRTNLRLR